MSRSWTAAAAGLLAVLGIALAATAGPGQDEPAQHATGGPPPMGWSSWSFLREHPTAAGIEAQARAMKSSGLVAAGYRYVNLDDFWMACNRYGPEVDAYGRWIPDRATFPDGIAAVARQVHAEGLKFGIYLTPGIAENAVRENTKISGTSRTAAQIAVTSVPETNYNCGHMYAIDYATPAGQDYIDGWADELASWGVDYVKLDGVGSWDVPDVRAWSAALRQTGRPMVLELSNSLAISRAAQWSALADGWRTGADQLGRGPHPVRRGGGLAALRRSARLERRGLTRAGQRDRRRPHRARAAVHDGPVVTGRLPADPRHRPDPAECR